MAAAVLEPPLLTTVDLELIAEATTLHLPSTLTPERAPTQ